MHDKRIEIEWKDSGRDLPEWAEPSDPNYPEGKDVTFPEWKGQSCKVNLPYPAKRVGYYSIHCPVCGQTAGLTTTGRKDDPRSVMLPCRPMTERLDRNKSA